jgi:hypothetical protein
MSQAECGYSRDDQQWKCEYIGSLSQSISSQKGIDFKSGAMAIYSIS